jgi:plasmid stabilization system protein ParE
MFKVVILPQAKKDIHEAAQWYHTKQPGLGKRFTGEVRSKVNFIERNPMACAKKYDDVRTAVLNIFPFLVHYTIDEIKNVIVISAVLHTSRNPNIWENR